MEQQTQPIVIAIDGFAATGKSTQAKKIAAHYSLTYIDTGAMYRAITWYAISKQWIADNSLAEEKLIEGLADIRLTFKTTDQGIADIYLNGQVLSDQIRSMEVSHWVSEVAKIPSVRSFLVKQQQALGAIESVVMDGRDIGTVVFPEATLKFFFTARPEIRAQRRLEELLPKQPQLTFEEVLANVNHRDHSDSTREHAPLKQGDDAHLIDVSDHSVSEIFDQLCKIIDDHLN